MEIRKMGFTLIEIIVVIAISSVLFIIALPRWNGFITIVEGVTCDTNLKTINKLYQAFIPENDLDDLFFVQFISHNINDICPSGGLITIINGKLVCSVHHNHIDEEETIDDEVPWL